MLVTAWDARPTKAIVNCFRKSGIFIETQETTIAEDKILSGSYRTKLTTFVPFNLTLLERTLMPLHLPLLMLKL